MGRGGSGDQAEQNPVSTDPPSVKQNDPMVGSFLKPAQHGQEDTASLLHRPSFTLDRAIEIAGHGRYQYQAFALLALTWSLVLSMTESCIPFIVSGAKDEWDLSGAETGAIGFGLVLGGTFGAPIGGWLCDTLGRKRVILYGSIWALVFHAICATSACWEMLAIIRFVFGFSISAVVNSCKVVVAEVFVAKLRGRWNAALHFFWQVGGVILITITFFLSDSQWRLLILITSLPGISIVVLQYQYLRETSRFLLDKVGVYHCMDELEFIAESNQETIPGGAEAALSCLCSHLWCAR